MVEKECKGEYDPNFNYQIKCELISCHGKYSYKCGDKCALDEATCSKYEDFRFANRRNRADLFSILNSNGEKSGKAKLKNFDQNTQKCPERLYEFKFNHICLSGAHCHEKIKLYSGFSKRHIHRKMNCSCEGIYNYECNSSYCSINKKSCDYFTNLSNDKNKTKQVLNKCGNDFVTKVKQINAYFSRIKFI